MRDCNTLSIGTLFYYQNIEGNKRDDEEGKSFYGLTSGDDVKVPANETLEIAGLIFHGASKDGSISVGEKGRLGSDIFYNCFIYCFSLLDEKNINLDYGKKLFGDEIDDYFYMDVKDINTFADYVASLLHSHIVIEDFHEKSQSILKGEIYKLFQWYAMSGEVKYVKEKKMLFENNKTADETINESIPEKLIFSKKQKYQEEKEFRIAFLPRIDQRRDLVLKLEPFRKILKFYSDIFKS